MAALEGIGMSVLCGAATTFLGVATYPSSRAGQSLSGLREHNSSHSEERAFPCPWQGCKAAFKVSFPHSRPRREASNNAPDGSLQHKSHWNKHILRHRADCPSLCESKGCNEALQVRWTGPFGFHLSCLLAGSSGSTQHNERHFNLPRPSDGGRSIMKMSCCLQIVVVSDSI
jgi:hypothetical protein